MRFSPRTVGVAAAVITVAIWTFFILVARASASHGLGPLDIALARVLGAGSVLLPWGAWLVRQDRREGRHTASLFGLSPLPLRVTAAAGLFGGLLYALLVYIGFFYAPAAHASALMSGSLPLWTTLWAALILGERIVPARALGLACIAGGGLLVGGTSLLHGVAGGGAWKGDLLFLCAAFCWAIYTVLARRFGLDAVRATIAITAFAMFTFVPAYALGVLSGALPSRLGTVPWSEFAFQALFQGVGSVALAGITFTQMVRHFGPVRSTLITALVPSLSALGAVLWLGEPLSWQLLAGLAFVTTGILFGVRAAAPRNPKTIATPSYSANTAV